MYYPSAFFRTRARAALKGRWQTALMIALIVNLPTLLVQAFAAFTGNDPVARLETVVLTASRDGILTQALLTREIEAYLRSSGFFWTAGLNVAAWLVTPCLALGMYKWLLDRLRGGTDAADAVSAVFSRFRLFFRAIGLQLLVILKILLWMLPGAAMFFAAMIPLYTAGNSAEALQGAMRLSNGLILPAAVLTAVPAAVAALRYAMAEWILADKPETRVLECLRRSKIHMRELKKMLFLLLCSFLLWYFLQLTAASLLSGMGSEVLSLMFQMLTGLALNVYVSASEGAFYLETKPADIPKPAPADEVPDTFVD